MYRIIRPREGNKDEGEHSRRARPRTRTPRSCLSTHLISGNCTSMRVLSGTPRRQSAMSSSPSVEQPICSPIFALRSFGSCTEAQGLSAEPLDNTTRWNNPAEEQTVNVYTGESPEIPLLGAKLVVTRTYIECTRRIRQDIVSFRPIERKRWARRELPQMVIILAWIIRGGRKYDRAAHRPSLYAGIVFHARRRKSDELTERERAIIGRLKTVTRRELQLNQSLRDAESTLSNFQFSIAGCVGGSCLGISQRN